jgi:hypothetical protein
MAMKRYDVEVIHEPSGAYLNYSFETDLDENELDIYKDFIRDISIVVNDVEEIEDELDTVDNI